MLKLYLDICCLKRPFDDQLLKAGERHGAALRVAFANPCDIPSETGP